MAKYQIVNEKGMQEIHSILAANHKLGGEHFDRAMLGAWAADVERRMEDGNGAYIEISAADTISGHTETHDLSPDSIEWAGEDDEDDE